MQPQIKLAGGSGAIGVENKRNRQKEIGREDTGKKLHILFYLFTYKILRASHAAQAGTDAVFL